MKRLNIAVFKRSMYMSIVDLEFGVRLVFLWLCRCNRGKHFRSMETGQKQNIFSKLFY